MKRPKSIIKAVSEIMKPDLYFCKLTKSKIGTFPHWFEYLLLVTVTGFQLGIYIEELFSQLALNFYPELEWIPGVNYWLFQDWSVGPAAFSPWCLLTVQATTSSLSSTTSAQTFLFLSSLSLSVSVLLTSTDYSSKNQPLDNQNKPPCSGSART